MGVVGSIPTGRTPRRNNRGCNRKNPYELGVNMEDQKKIDATFKLAVLCGSLLAFAVGQWFALIAFLVIVVIFKGTIKDLLK